MPQQISQSSLIIDDQWSKLLLCMLVKVSMGVRKNFPIYDFSFCGCEVCKVKWVCVRACVCVCVRVFVCVHVCVFSCGHASLQEPLSVRRSVRPSVGLSMDTSRKVWKRAFPPLPTRPQLVWPCIPPLWTLDCWAWLLMSVVFGEMYICFFFLNFWRQQRAPQWNGGKFNNSNICSNHFLCSHCSLGPFMGSLASPTPLWDGRNTGICVHTNAFIVVTWNTPTPSSVHSEQAVSEQAFRHCEGSGWKQLCNWSILRIRERKEEFIVSYKWSMKMGSDESGKRINGKESEKRGWWGRGMVNREWMEVNDRQSFASPNRSFGES